MADARDPKTIITANAFTVAPHLLGLPLARPARRAFAMLFDLIIVAIMIKAIGFTVFALAAALLLFRIARPSGKGGTLRRGAALGVRIAGVLMLAGFAFALFDNARDFVTDRVSVNSNDNASSDQPVVDVDAVVRNAIEGTTSNTNATADSVDVSSIRGYAEAVGRGDTAAAGQFYQAAQKAIAGTRIGQLESSLEESRDSLENLHDALEQEREGRGIRGFIAGLLEDVGVGFGWMAVYFTAFVVLWNGQTPGKRLLGIRIIRLDAKPLSWWFAFERFGGYAASASTGLLGFAQILWDRNRQGIHDKVASTVVIRERGGRATVEPRAARFAPHPPPSAPPGNRPPA